MKDVMEKIFEKVGEPAMLEQLAEECGELAMACLKVGHIAQKMARIERNDNPTPKTLEECIEEFHVEAADLEICIEAMMLSPWVQVDRINYYYDEYLKRWHDRLEIGEDRDGDKTD